MRKRVICDENLPHKLRTLIPEHDLFSVAYMQWIGIKNGELLDVAERAHFDVLITSDQGIPHQQNMAERRLAVVLLRYCQPRTGMSSNTSLGEYWLPLNCLYRGLSRGWNSGRETSRDGGERYGALKGQTE
jgi:hypothetical protein